MAGGDGGANVVLRDNTPAASQTAMGYRQRGGLNVVLDDGIMIALIAKAGRTP
jgi:hypothetical protein